MPVNAAAIAAALLLLLLFSRLARLLLPLLLLLRAGGSSAVADVPVLHVLSALLLMLEGSMLLAEQLEGMAPTLTLLLHVLAWAELYQLACRACASALLRQPLCGE